MAKNYKLMQAFFLVAFFMGASPFTGVHNICWAADTNVEKVDDYAKTDEDDSDYEYYYSDEDQDEDDSDLPECIKIRGVFGLPEDCFALTISRNTLEHPWVAESILPNCLSSKFKPIKEKNGTYLINDVSSRNLYQIIDFCINNYQTFNSVRERINVGQISRLIAICDRFCFSKLHRHLSRFSLLLDHANKQKDNGNYVDEQEMKIFGRYRLSDPLPVNKISVRVVMTEYETAINKKHIIVYVNNQEIYNAWASTALLKEQVDKFRTSDFATFLTEVFGTGAPGHNGLDSLLKSFSKELDAPINRISDLKILDEGKWEDHCREIVIMRLEGKQDNDVFRNRVGLGTSLFRRRATLGH